MASTHFKVLTRFGGAVQAACLIVLGGCGQAATRLPAVDARADQTSVSGLSSGAYMAAQFEIAHSEIIVGAALIAGGPYGCAESLYADAMPGPGTAFINLSKAVNGCMLDALRAWGIPNPSLLARRAERLADQGRIDPLGAVRRHRLYLFTGREDRTVVPAIVAAARDFYLAAHVPPDQIKFVSSIPAGHAFVTDSAASSCDKTAAPYIVDCRYDMAGEMLRQIYGDLAPRSASPQGELISFDQREFLGGLSNHGMRDIGAAYVPADCRASERCRVHIAFHGCAQNRAAVGEAFIRESGLLRWADTNRLVVLFPEVEHTPANPQGCWDWWGYIGQDFLTKHAPQIIAVHRMLERLAGPKSMI